MRLASVTAVFLLVIATNARSAAAEDWQSAEATRMLLERMQSSQLDAVAVRDPETPERFIAALRLPGQLLVVSATHPSVELVAQRLAQGAHRDVYMDLQGTPAQESKFFIHDMEADGLRLGGRGDAYDMIYDAGQVIACDGRWKQTKLDKDAYRERLELADGRYARMLGLLAGTFETPESSR